MRFFASRTPTIPLYCSKGRTLKWPGRGEGMVAVADDDSATLLCLQRCISTGRGGDIREVTGEEFAEWQKKTAGQPQFFTPERESFSGNEVVPTSQVRGVSGVRPPPTSPPPQEAAAVAVGSRQPAPAAPQATADADRVRTPIIPTRRQGANPPSA